MDIEKYESLMAHLDKMSKSELESLYNDIDKKVKQDSFDKFIEYNYQDVILINKLDDKLNFFQVALSLAHVSKSNPDDIYATVKPWDNMMYGHLHNMGIVIPPKEYTDEDTKYMGGFVKNPVLGRSNWIVSLDLTSLYPSIIMMLNMSFETLRLKSKVDVETIIEQMIDMTYKTDIAHEKNYTISANGTLYDKSEEGVIPQLMQKLFDMRAAIKKELKDTERELERLKKLKENEDNK